MEHMLLWPWQWMIRRKQTPKIRLLETHWWPGSLVWWSSYFSWLYLEEQVLRVVCLVATRDNQTATSLLLAASSTVLSFFSHSCSEERWEDSWRIWVSKKFSALPSVSLHWVQLLWRHSSVWWVGALCCSLQNKVSAHFLGNAKKTKQKTNEHVSVKGTSA